VKERGATRHQAKTGSEPAAVIPDTVIAIDWSGDASAAGQRRKIWAGVWRAGRVTLESGRTREELVEWLIGMAQQTPRMVVGVDFCFSYPAWFVREHGAGSAVEFWEIVARHGEHWLERECAEVRFWGRVGPRRTGKKPAEFCGDAGARRMLRVADCECKLAEQAAEPELVRGIAPKSPFQIGGAGAVGTGTLRGIPLLGRLRAGGFAVWPFDAARLPLLVEIYPRLLTGPVKKSRREARVRYLRAMKERDVLTPKARSAAEESEDAFDAAVSAVRMGARREEFARLRRLGDPMRQMEGKVWGAGG
jgi:hypothetical protein